MKITATEFKAKCLGLMDQMGKGHDPILITKHGKVVAQLAPAPHKEKKPWLALRGSVKIKGDLLKPLLSKKELDSYLKRTANQISGTFD